MACYIYEIYIYRSMRVLKCASTLMYAYRAMFFFFAVVFLLLLLPTPWTGSKVSILYLLDKHLCLLSL